MNTLLFLFYLYIFVLILLYKTPYPELFTIYDLQ